MKTTETNFIVSPVLNGWGEATDLPRQGASPAGEPSSQPSGQSPQAREDARPT
ncbi:MAG: hypothetical protein QM813_23805 [Verrucomicrobiota bacterium]